MGIYYPHSTRFPYGVLIATLIGILAVILFCSILHEGTTLSILYFAEKFNMNFYWINMMQTTFTILGFFTGALISIIFAVEYLENRDAREGSGWKARLGGRTGSLMLMSTATILYILWMVVFCLLAIVTFMSTIFLFLCRKPKVTDFSECINISPFDFLLEKDAFQMCGESEITPFCSFMEKVHPLYVLTAVAAALIILTLIYYLMRLAAKYGSLQHIKYEELKHNLIDSINQTEKCT